MRIQVQDLRISYRDRRAVTDVSFAVEPGQVVAIVGPNGCGKSTLLRGLARLLRPSAGQVLIGEQDIWSLSPRQAAQRVALLPQAPLAPEAVTVASLVRYGRHPHQGLFRQWSSQDEQAVSEAMTATGVTELANRRLDQLSGGQRQRCWLAMTFAQQTPVVLLDEPTSALDLGCQAEVLELIQSAAHSGRTMIMVIHDLSAAARYADQLIALRTGRIVASGPAGQIITADLVRALYGVEANVLRAPNDGAPVVVPARQDQRTAP